MQTFADIVALWPNAVALAGDIGESPVTVRAWRLRNSIHASHWRSIVRAAEGRGIKLTLDDLARIAEREVASSMPQAMRRRRAPAHPEGQAA
ncbi:MAG TPA: hypothetical protein VEZ26_00220 [Sphingomonadaceae bacterium]|nr:hypothetical protein [Sphingomonadaceae bacterium]